VPANRQAIEQETERVRIVQDKQAPDREGGQRLLEPLAVHFEAGHLLRDPVDYLPIVGFEIDEG
jgi:hypothetical protein